MSGRSVGRSVGGRSNRLRPKGFQACSRRTTERPGNRPPAPAEELKRAEVDFTVTVTVTVTVDVDVDVEDGY